ncbi:MAG: hypothetical protein M3463_05150 [Verrucomicrobiota bacterium]|nr:hypothetical protein [Verrucomicrobiota bacterium]
MKPQNFQILFTVLPPLALLLAPLRADDGVTRAARTVTHRSAEPRAAAPIPETRQNLRFAPLMGTPFANLDALLTTKLKDWKRSDKTSTSEIGSVTYEADGVTLILWFKTGKFTSFAIGSNATDAAVSERRHHEAQDALQVASDQASISGQASTSVRSDAAPAASLARFQKQHFDALIKEGFTREDALQIIASSPAPASNPAPATPATK